MWAGKTVKLAWEGSATTVSNVNPTAQFAKKKHGQKKLHNLVQCLK